MPGAGGSGPPPGPQPPVPRAAPGRTPPARATWMSRTGCRRSPLRWGPWSKRSRRQDPFPRRGRQALGGVPSTRHRSDAMTSLVPDRPTPRLSPSARVLVAANLVPLAGVLFLDWSVFATLLVFWVENVIVGAFNVLRMLVAQPQIGAMWAAKLFMIPFFTFHYGMFVTVHGVFVLALFGG